MQKRTMQRLVLTSRSLTLNKPKLLVHFARSSFEQVENLTFNTARKHTQIADTVTADLGKAVTQSIVAHVKKIADKNC